MQMGVSFIVMFSYKKYKNEMNFILNNMLRI